MTEVNLKVVVNACCKICDYYSNKTKYCRKYGRFSSRYDICKHFKPDKMITVMVLEKKVKKKETVEVYPCCRICEHYSIGHSYCLKHGKYYSMYHVCEDFMVSRTLAEELAKRKESKKT